MICVTISQTMAALPTADAEAPTFDHGETEDNPSPVPNASRISDNAAATNAPPITAAQDTPDEYASFLNEVSANPDCWWAAEGEGGSVPYELFLLRYLWIKQVIIFA